MLRRQLSARTDNCDVIGVIHPQALFPFTARAACDRIEETADHGTRLECILMSQPLQKTRIKSKCYMKCETSLKCRRLNYAIVRQSKNYFLFFYWLCNQFQFFAIRQANCLPTKVCMGLSIFNANAVVVIGDTGRPGRVCVRVERHRHICIQCNNNSS